VQVHRDQDGNVLMSNPSQGGLSLKFTAAEWEAFIGGCQNGEFDQFGQPRE
jgi:hypothetical protein